MYLRHGDTETPWGWSLLRAALQRPRIADAASTTMRHGLSYQPVAGTRGRVSPTASVPGSDHRTHDGQLPQESEEWQGTVCRTREQSRV